MLFLFYIESSNICEDNIHMLPSAKTKEERFIFTDFNPEIHFVCFWDEFKVPESIETFKQVIGGETFCVDVKQHESKKLTYRVPIIMVSNKSEEELMEDCNNERGVRERILFVHADTKPKKVSRRVAIEEKISKRK